MMHGKCIMLYVWRVLTYMCKLTPPINLLNIHEYACAVTSALSLSYGNIAKKRDHIVVSK